MRIQVGWPWLASCVRGLGLAVAWIFMVPVLLAAPAGVKIVDLRCESTVRPLGLDTPQPRLSWKLQAASAASAGLRGQSQSAYRILVAGKPDGFGNETADLWDSGRVSSDASAQIAYAGKPLTENQQAFWKVQVWDQSGNASEWSETSRWSMGLFENASWQGQWIGSGVTAEVATTLETRFTIVKEAFALYFHAEGAGNSCMWQINTTGGRTRFVPHLRVDGGFRVLKEVPLPIDPTAFRTSHSMKIVIKGATIETFLDGKSIDTTTEETRHGGGFGFRASSSEEALIHELTVSSAAGKALFQQEYPKGLKVANDEVMLGLPNPALTPLLRKEFAVAKPVRRAWIHASSLGIYEMRLNGKKVGDAFFAPGWTNYRKAVEYQTFDVTDLLKPGTNAIGAELAPGWFAGKIGWFGPGRYGTEPRFIAEVHVDYADGTSTVVAQSDETWKASPGPVVAADFQDGETYDARLEKTGWDQAGFKDGDWQAVRKFEPFEKSRLVAQTEPLMNVLETLPAVGVTEPKPGVYVYQLPRNITGVPRVKIRGVAGATVNIRCSEAVNADGSLNQKTQVQPGISKQFSANADAYTFATSGEVVYHPRFSWRGFRYIEVSGTSGKPAPADVAGLSIGSHVTDTGHLVTSDELVNRIFNIMKWSGQCAYISIPVDSPQRCERLGWTGDANFYLKTATFNFDVERFFTKWQRDNMHSQTAEGCYSNVAPGGWGPGADGGYGGGWGDVGVCAPYELWRTYRNTALVRESYGSMARYLTYLESRSTGLIVTGEMAPAGDWQNQGDGTPGDYIATAYFAYDVKLMAEMARAIGKDDEAVKYEDLFKRIREAIRAKWITADGKVASGSQTAQVMALHIGLVPEEAKEAAVKQLVANIERHGNHLTTGFVGTQWLLPVLSDGGRTDMACAVLRQTSNPSWGYMVERGSTTIWENWNVMRSDGSVIDGANSLNHCALGTAGEWMYRNIGGIDQEEGSAGYSKVLIKPTVTRILGGAKTEFESIRGTIATEWKKGPHGLDLKVEIPVNSRAMVHVPCTEVATVKESGQPAGRAAGVKYLRSEAGCAVFEVGSGTYLFNAP